MKPDRLTPADLGELAGIVEDLLVNTARGDGWRNIAPAVRPGVRPQLDAVATWLRTLAANGVTVESIGTPAPTLRGPYTWCDSCEVAHDGQGRIAPRAEIGP